MFCQGMDVVLEYGIVPAITNDPFSKRTMKVENSRYIESARWTIVFKVRYIYKRFSQVAVNDDGFSGNP